MVNTLTKFSISQQSSTFEGKKNISSSIIDSNSLTKEVMQNLFEEFQVLVKHFQHQQNIEIKNLVIERKIKNSDMYKDEHPKKVYQALYFEKDCYIQPFHDCSNLLCLSHQTEYIKCWTRVFTTYTVINETKNLFKIKKPWKAYEAYSHETHATWHGGKKNTFKQINLCYNKHGLYFCTVWDCC